VGIDHTYSRSCLLIAVCTCPTSHRQARQLKDCLKLTQELLRLSARDASLSLQLSAQQVRVELTQKELKLAEATIK
jgi:hypothetical protein